MSRGLLIAAAALAAASFGTAAQAGGFGESGYMCNFGANHVQSVMKTLPPAEEATEQTVAATEEPAPVEDVDVEALLSSLTGSDFKLPQIEDEG